MDIKLNISMDAETLSAIQALTAALTASAPAPAAEAAEKPAPAKAEKAEKAADKGPFYWADNEAGTFGQVDTADEYKSLKAENANVVRIPESKYNDLVKAKKAAAEKAKKAEEAKAAKSGKGKKAETPAAVTKQDLITTFTEYLPKDLDADERAERREFVQTLLQRFGADKVSNLLEQHWATAIDLVKRKMAGEDIDPSEANFADAGSDEDDDLV